MTRFKSIFAAVVLAAIVSVVPAQAATVVKVVGSGSSAMWQQFALAAFNGLCDGGGAGSNNCSHFTVKGKNGTNNYAQLFDQRSSSIPNEAGSLWVVWGPDTNGVDTDVWAYITEDSTLGNRCFFATPRCLLQIDSGVITATPPPTQTNQISAALFTGNGADAALLPQAIYTALNGHAVTAGMTDIRPEDAKFAQSRVVSVLNSTTYAGLGYGTGSATLVGTQIQGAAYAALGTASPGVFTPVAFNITGKDPFTALAIPASTTIPVGAAPIIFIINRTAGGVLAGTNPININTFSAQRLYAGNNCAASAIDMITNGGADGPVHVVKREPLSGTYNTTEFTVMRTASQPNNSQETGWVPSTDNGTIKPCVHGGGDRGVAIGTGNMVKVVKGTTDSIGYLFFSYGSVSSIAANANFGYLTLNGLDPITGTYTNGQLPTCAGPCALAPNTSFPTLRNGGYAAWSKYRVVTDKTGVNNTNTVALVNAAEATVNSIIPDFVPAAAQADGDLGLLVFRSHYGTGAHNGINNPPSAAEAGQDMGGCINLVADEKAIAPAEILNCKQ